MRWGPATVLCSAVVVALAVTGCGRSQVSGEGGKGGGKLVLTGSSTIAPMASDLAAAFEASHPSLRIDVQMGGSSRGVADARGKLADIGMVSRALKDSESDLLAHTIALDGICMIVHATNPVKALTDDQVRDIYTGKIDTWDAVGGPSAPITVVNKAEGRSTLELFLHYYGLEASDIDADVIIGDNQQGIKTVSGNPHGIGYVSIGTAEYEVNHGASLHLLPVGGVAASVANVRNGTFPLSRPLNLVTSAEPAGIAAEFISYARSTDAHAIILRHYFVPSVE